jgi:hypothetical protein
LSTEARSAKVDLTVGKPHTLMPRDFLIYTPASRGDFAGDFVHPDRLFDLAVNDWTGSGKFSKQAEQAEYKFAEKGHKWQTIAKLLPQLPRYQFYAFIDEDIDASVDTLNGLFRTGEALGLSVFQGALTPRSYSNHEFVYVQAGSYARATNFVEIMAPFFSRDALAQCAPTFTLSELGWGLEYLWNDILRSQGLAIVDRFPVTHIRPVQSNRWKNQRGESAEQECARMLAEWNARK